jgi:membrane protein
MFNQFMGLLSAAMRTWQADDAEGMAAALAFYTAVSMTPLVIIIITILGFFVGDEAARGHLSSDLTLLMSRDTAQFIESVIESADKPKIAGLTRIFSLLVLIWGSSNVFAQLQLALNRIWHVTAADKPGLWTVLRRRFLSFGMVLGVVFVLLVSLLISTVLASALDSGRGSLPGPDALWAAANLVISYLVITVLFAAVFKIVPQIHIDWRDVWAGALLTSLLFNAGKFVLSLYIGSRETSYDAGSSLLAVLLWTYYSAQILFFGAEFTQSVARRRAGMANAIRT